MSGKPFTRQDVEFVETVVRHYALFEEKTDDRQARLIFAKQKFHAEHLLTRMRAAVQDT